MSGILFLVSTPIGDADDITLRGLRILSEVDAVICEERRIGSRLLADYKINRPLVELNEHTEEGSVPLLIERLVRGESLALISDHGTPLVADPGASLVTSALQAGLRMVPVPGASAVMAALVASGLPAHRFRFLGQLPPKTELRRRALRELKNLPETLILLDAPYRLMPLLKDVQRELGHGRPVAVACDLTMPDERLLRGAVGVVIEALERQPFRGEFVLIIQGHNTARNLKGELT
jgi:16S rRNA (cytidine1402-2'-O)-methyltransferase